MITFSSDLIYLTFPGLCCCPFFLDMTDQSTLTAFQANGAGHIIINVGNLYPDTTAGYLAMLLELLDYLHGLIDGDSQGNAHEPPTARDYLGIYTHYLTLGVEQGTA